MRVEVRIPLAVREVVVGDRNESCLLGPLASPSPPAPGRLVLEIAQAGFDSTAMSSENLRAMHLVRQRVCKADLLRRIPREVVTGLPCSTIPIDLVLN